MKKEKRELTLKQLEEKERIESKTPLILLILGAGVFFILMMITIIASIFLKNNVNIIKIYLIGIYIELFLIVLLVINYWVSEKTSNQIILKQKQMNVMVLKQLAKEHEDCIKNFVSLKDEKAITDILSNNIARITIEFIQDKNFVTTIQYADGTSMSGIHIPTKEFVAILDEDSKKIMLNKSIKNIILENSAGDTKKIIIESFGYDYEKYVSDDELLEMFELKE